MNADAMSSALVLGGGGITGIAWEIGLLHGLHESGVDLTDADTVVGTSAGSVVGCRRTSRSWASTTSTWRACPSRA